MDARILIVDDHEIVREGIRGLIARSRPEWKICAEATNGEEAIEVCRTLKPDVMILDITMPVMSGLEAAMRMTQLGFGCRLLMFTMHESQRLDDDVRRVGAQGVVLKTRAAHDLIRAIDRLLAGGTFFESGASQQNPPAQGAASDVPSNDKRAALGPCRVPIRRLMANRANLQIISPFTTHSPFEACPRRFELQTGTTLSITLNVPPYLLAFSLRPNLNVASELAIRSASYNKILIFRKRATRVFGCQTFFGVVRWFVLVRAER